MRSRGWTEGGAGGGRRGGKGREVVVVVVVVVVEWIEKVTQHFAFTAWKVLCESSLIRSPAAVCWAREEGDLLGNRCPARGEMPE